MIMCVRCDVKFGVRAYLAHSPMSESPVVGQYVDMFEHTLAHTHTCKKNLECDDSTRKIHILVYRAVQCVHTLIAHQFNKISKPT